MDIWTAVSEDRLALADMLEGLSEEQWSAASLCSGWSVKDVAAHVAPTVGGGFTEFFVALVRSGFNPDRASRRVVRGSAEVPTSELIADLRLHAAQRSAPPGLGPASQLADVLVHTLDIAVPLDIVVRRPDAHWHAALAWLVTPQARRGFVREGCPAVTLVTDRGRYGEGPEVRGPAPALALALCGRDAVMDDLSGPGLQEFALWVRRASRGE